jgi:hypothetical protein
MTSALKYLSLEISRIIRTRFLLASTGALSGDEISEAIRQINEEFNPHRTAAPTHPSLIPPSLQPAPPPTSDENGHF